MSTTADIKTEGILDYLDYFRKFNEFRQRFTDEDGITLKDVLDAGMALAQVLSFGPEGKELRDVIESIQRKDSLSRTLDEVIEFLTILNKRIAAFTKEQGEAAPADELQTIPVTTTAAPPSLSEICGQVADGIAPYCDTNSTEVTTSAQTGVPPIVIGLVIQGLVKLGEWAIRRIYEKRQTPIT